MKIFSCSNCGHAVYFENSRCVRCDSSLQFDPVSMSIKVESSPLCHNGRVHNACNWVAVQDSHDNFCVACSLNRNIPNLNDDRNLTLWRTIQMEKNRLVYSLLRFGLPVMSQRVNSKTGLAFDFLDSTTNTDSKVLTGHNRGVITLDIREADDAHREAVRQSLGEPYRTLLGHFRHESAHYYWDRLVRGTPWLEKVRSVFGDDRIDYKHALSVHYKKAPPLQWSDQYISRYACAHPWEDWAETWAHYIHIIDTLESASELGLALDPKTGRSISLPELVAFDSYHNPDVNELMEKWLAVSVALNLLNRSLGQADAYPFVNTPAIINKLTMVHNIISQARESG